MKKPRRQRYYAYTARQGGVLWINKSTHAFIQSRPHTVSHFQCKEFTTWTMLMTEVEAKAELEQWREKQAQGGYAQS